MTNAHGGQLASQEGPTSRATSTHDPDDLVPATVVNPFAMLFEYPDERQIGERGDVLTFTGDANLDDLDLVGPVDLTLRISSTAPTTDIIAKLFDVDPDGSARIIAWGDAQVDTVDTDPEFTIDLGHVGYRLRAGHRLRLQMASSEYPAFQPNPGTEQPAWTATETKASDQTLVCDAICQVHLSVLPS